LFCGVNENKKEGKGAGNSYSRFERKCFDKGEEIFNPWRLWLILASCTTGRPEALHCLKTFLAFQSKDHPAEDGAEPPHIVVQCPVFGVTAVFRKQIHLNPQQVTDSCHLHRTPCRERIYAFPATSPYKNTPNRVKTQSFVAKYYM
jgi:hypothetical protein